MKMVYFLWYLRVIKQVRLTENQPLIRQCYNDNRQYYTYLTNQTTIPNPNPNPNVHTTKQYTR